MKKPQSPEALRIRMADLCARSEQCASDIRRKLLNAGLAPAQAEQVVDDLRRGKFIDDARFARAYAADKVRFSAWGGRKIRAYLASKGIASSFISAALDAVDPDEYRQAALRAARANGKGLDLTTREDNVKLYRHMLSRGFSSQEAVEAVKAVRKEGGE